MDLAGREDRRVLGVIRVYDLAQLPMLLSRRRAPAGEPPRPGRRASQAFFRSADPAAARSAGILRRAPCGSARLLCLARSLTPVMGHTVRCSARRIWYTTGTGTRHGPSTPHLGSPRRSRRFRDRRPAHPCDSRRGWLVARSDRYRWDALRDLPRRRATAPRPAVPLAAPWGARGGVVG